MLIPGSTACQQCGLWNPQLTRKTPTLTYQVVAVHLNCSQSKPFVRAYFPTCTFMAFSTFSLHFCVSVNILIGLPQFLRQFVGGTILKYFEVFSASNLRLKPRRKPQKTLELVTSRFLVRNIQFIKMQGLSGLCPRQGVGVYISVYISKFFFPEHLPPTHVYQRQVFSKVHSLTLAMFLLNTAGAYLGYTQHLLSCQCTENENSSRASLYPW